MHRKTGFTMVEIILILVVISTALIGIITGVTKTTRYVSEMRQRTLAMNLAKEGIEIMYQIRDTNWERWSANKDQCWLKADPMFDDGDGCENDPWIRKGDWSIEREEINGQTYHRLHSVDANADSLHTALGKWHYHINIDPTHEHHHYRLYFFRGDWIPYNVFTTLTLDQRNEAEAYMREGDYFRVITIEGLYPKRSNNPEAADLMTCDKGEDLNSCGSTSPKELRFCSTVIYTQPYQGQVRICALATNFLE